MPRLVPISHHETFAVQALRRTLWQLAFVGLATAAAIVRIAPDSRALASWCVLIPLCALAMHFRHRLLDLLSTHRRLHANQITSRRMQRPQARRAPGDGLSGKRRQSRVRLARDAARSSPLAR